MYKILLLLILNIGFIYANAPVLQKIKLQLQWKHQFEFAGFYAAQEKGFYKEVGLDVEFVEYTNSTDITQEVLDGNAQYGVTYASIIAQYLNGKPVVLLANFFKQSPLVLVAQKGIDTPRNLKNKRVMGVLDAIDSITLTSMLEKFGVNSSDIINVLPSFNINDFIEKRVDAMAVFTTNELYTLSKNGVKYNIFERRSYGSKYYDVNLFTTQKEIENNPNRVKNFRDASIKGWEYALKHQDEIIELILKKYNTQNKSKDALAFEAKQIEQLMLPTVYPIGSIDKFRVKVIADSFIQSGFVTNSKNRDLDKLIFKNTLHNIYLTQKEKEFIEKHPQIVLGSGDSWAPYVIENSDGSITGYDNDILTKINHVTGANFVLTVGNWSKIQELAKTKKLDGLSTLTKTTKREAFFNFSNVYISLQKMVMVKQRNPLNIKSAKDLANKTIVIHKGNVADERAAKEFKNSIVIYADTPKKMLEEVIYGKADATFGNGATEYMLSDLGLPYIENAFLLKDSLNLRFAIRKDWNEAISILNKGLATISTHERTMLKQKWFSPTPYNINKKINFTKEEKLYLKNKKRITMCVDAQWMPLEGIKYGQHNGFIADYIKMLNQKIDIPIQLVKTKSWSESLKKAKNRECDILSSAEKTPLREKYMDFTTPYLDIPIVIATKKEMVFISNIEQVLDKRLGVVKGYSLNERLKLEYPDIHIVEVDSIGDGLSRVENGTLFGYLDNAISINYEIQKNFIDILTISGKLKGEIYIRIATRNDQKILGKIFEKLILSVDTAEKQQMLNKWVNISYKTKIDYTLIWKILILFGLIFILFIYKQYAIKKLNSKLQSKIEEELKISRDKDRVIFQQSKLAAMGEMIENIAHQWRQPLSQINSAVLIIDDELYTQKFEDEIIQQKLDEIERMTKYMSSTIDDFKSFYAYDKIKEWFNVNDSMMVAISLVESSFKYNRIDISIDIDKEINIYGYKNEFQQSILVILNNAKDVLVSSNIKNPKISIALEITDSSYILSIYDNGGGIKDDILSKIFEPYFTTKHKSQGIGLGLYLSKMILEESMGAKLYAKNIYSGVCFYVEFKKESKADAK